jgi:hypothetical protein
MEEGKARRLFALYNSCVAVLRRQGNSAVEGNVLPSWGNAIMASKDLNQRQELNSRNADSRNAEKEEHHAAAEPSGPRGDNPGTAGPGNTKVQSNSPENNLGHINPSAPEDANVTPGTVGKK